MAESRRLQLAGETLRRFAASLRSVQLYAAFHPLVEQNIAALAETLGIVHGYTDIITIGLMGDEVVVDGMPLPSASAAMAATLKRLRDEGVERISFERGVTRTELTDTILHLAGRVPGRDGAGETGLPWFEQNSEKVPHVRVGGLTLEKRFDSGPSDAVAVREMYRNSVTVAESIWKSLAEANAADPLVIQGLVNDLAQALTHSPTALLALTTLNSYDNYTFTHMVNVAILVMAQARSLGVEGALLREFGVAGLMHDIGKVRTPMEILNKPGALTEEEFEVMKRHPADGATILRRMDDVPPLAAVVAFEHHLRLDGRGYPAGVVRESLNVGTQMTAIADVYDAMRSKRQYQQAFPTDRILAVLKAGDGTRFDARLVRRFVQIVGIYPVGNLVRLDTGHVAVVLKVHAADPNKPLVCLLFEPDGSRCEANRKVALWLSGQAPGEPSTVIAPVDAAKLGIDPLAYI
ncbi:MAG: HD-GYP domain-containing protein [Vicinamibacterales bacterium]